MLDEVVAEEVDVGVPLVVVDVAELEPPVADDDDVAEEDCAVEEVAGDSVAEVTYVPDEELSVPVAPFA